jgi:hypothetical protein
MLCPLSEARKQSLNWGGIRLRVKPNFTIISIEICVRDLMYMYAHESCWSGVTC